MFQDLQKTFGGALAGAVLAVAVLFGIGGTGSNSTPTLAPPSAPALESGQAVVYFCKPDIVETIDNTQPNAIPGSTDFGRAKVIHTCKAPDGTFITLDGKGIFIDAHDGKGLPLTEAQIKDYLR